MNTCVNTLYYNTSPPTHTFLNNLDDSAKRRHACLAGRGHRNDGVDLERASATWSTSSFTSYHGQLLSLAVQCGVALEIVEIERAIKTSARFC